VRFNRIFEEKMAVGHKENDSHAEVIKRHLKFFQQFGPNFYESVKDMKDGTIQFKLPKGEHPLIINEALGKAIEHDHYKVIDEEFGEKTYQLAIQDIENAAPLERDRASLRRAVPPLTGARREPLNDPPVKPEDRDGPQSSRGR